MACCSNSLLAYQHKRISHSCVRWRICICITVKEMFLQTFSIQYLEKLVKEDWGLESKKRMAEASDLNTMKVSLRRLSICAINYPFFTAPILNYVNKIYYTYPTDQGENKNTEWQRWQQEGSLMEDWKLCVTLRIDFFYKFREKCIIYIVIFNIVSPNNNPSLEVEITLSLWPIFLL